MVFDGRIAITGGRNIGDNYFDRSTEFNFIDRDILVIGSVADDMEKSFEQYWIDPITFDLDQLVDVREHLFIDDKQQILPIPEFPDISGFDEIGCLHQNRMLGTSNRQANASAGIDVCLIIFNEWFLGTISNKFYVSKAMYIFNKLIVNVIII